MWFVWDDGAAYLVFGGTEQPAPGLAELGTAVVYLRSKDKGGLLVSWEASVTHLRAGDADWPTASGLLLAKRLNAQDGEGAGARWAAECQIARLVPIRVLLAPDSMPTDSGSAPPRATSATSPVPIPYTLRFRKPRNPRRGLG